MIGVSGHCIGKARKTPRAAWANAAPGLRAKSTGEPQCMSGTNG